MEVIEAIEHLVNSDEFKAKAKQKNAEGGKYRMFLTKYKRNQLKNGAMFDFLIDNGYRVDIKKPK